MAIKTVEKITKLLTFDSRTFQKSILIIANEVNKVNQVLLRFRWSLLVRADLLPNLLISK